MPEGTPALLGLSYRFRRSGKEAAGLLGRPRAEEAAAEHRSVVGLLRQHARPPHARPVARVAPNDAERATVNWRGPAACAAAGRPRQSPARTSQGRRPEPPIGSTGRAAAGEQPTHPQSIPAASLLPRSPDRRGPGSRPCSGASQRH